MSEWLVLIKVSVRVYACHDQITLFTKVKLESLARLLLVWLKKFCTCKIVASVHPQSSTAVCEQLGPEWVCATALTVAVEAKHGATSSTAFISQTRDLNCQLPSHEPPPPQHSAATALHQATSKGANLLTSPWPPRRAEADSGGLFK